MIPIYKENRVIVIIMLNENEIQFYTFLIFLSVLSEQSSKDSSDWECLGSKQLEKATY